MLKTLTGRKLDRRYGLPCGHSGHSGRLLNGALTGLLSLLILLFASESGTPTAVNVRQPR